MSAHLTQEEYQSQKKDIYRTTIILSIVTIVEVLAAFVYDEVLEIATRWPLSVFVVLASAIKAFYIMAVFMHVKHENKYFIYSILVPFLFLVWAIIAFSWEGDSWHTMRTWFNNSFM